MRSLHEGRRQRAIPEPMVDGMVTITRPGTVLRVNNAVTRLFGYTSSLNCLANVRVIMPEPYSAAHDLLSWHLPLSPGESKILGGGAR